MNDFLCHFPRLRRRATGFFGRTFVADVIDFRGLASSVYGALATIHTRVGIRGVMMISPPLGKHVGASGVPLSSARGRVRVVRTTCALQKCVRRRQD